MNFIRNPLRQGFLLRNLGVEPFFSTAAESIPAQVSSIQVSSPVAEPDKLYKRVELEIRGNDKEVLKSYAWFSTAAAGHLGVEVGKSWAIRKAEKERFTMYKCVHIFKRHKVQYELRTYYRFIHLHKLTGSSADTLLEYLERNLPEGVAMKVTKVEIQRPPEYLLKPPSNELDPN